MFRRLSKTAFKNVCILFGLVFLIQSNAYAEIACRFDRSGPMPVCGALKTSPGTDVVVINGHESNIPSNVLLGPNEHSAEALDIVIGEVERPLTIVVSHYDATVFNFSGNVDQIAQVVAMGARTLGWDHVAVTGIDASKVRFLPVVGSNPNLVTDCSGPPKSCVPEQYFTFDGPPPSWIGLLPLDPRQIRTQATLLIDGLRKSTIFIPPRPKTSAKPMSKNAPSGVRTVFERSQITSPTTVTLDPDLPSWGGIKRLMEQGSLRPAGDYTSDPDLMRFSEAFSERYRSRFDPDYRFEPKIDFVLSPHFTGKLPRDLQRGIESTVTFLVTGQEPEFTSVGDQGRYCFYSERYQLAQPGHGSSNSAAWKKWGSICRGPGKSFMQTRQARLTTYQLHAARYIENHRKWGTKLCKLLEIPDEAEIVVLATELGRTGDNLSVRSCGISGSYHVTGLGVADETTGEPIVQCQAGQVDVAIDRKGPVFLFLKGSGAIQWNLSVSDSSQISGIVTVGGDRQMLTGLPEGVRFSQYVTRDRGLPDGCGNTLLDASPLVGGPSIQLFEMMFEQISGRNIDVLISKGLIPDKVDQTPEVIRDYTTFIVD